MNRRSILEPVTPRGAAFDARAMSRGQPGVPTIFDWRGRTYRVVEVLGDWRETENYSGAPKDSYVKRHGVRVRTDSGYVMVLTASRGTRGAAARWMLRHIEEATG